MKLKKGKNGVSLLGVRPELIIGLMVADTVCREIGVDLTITSICDGVHSATSLHYTGAAADIRTRDMTESQIPRLMTALVAALTNDFDVVLESNHIHLEYQPRKPG